MADEENPYIDFKARLEAAVETALLDSYAVEQEFAATKENRDEMERERDKLISIKNELVALLDQLSFVYQYTAAGNTLTPYKKDKP